MIVVYSKSRIKGLEGVYANPDLFNGDTEICDTVYTNDEAIKTAYESKGIKVETIAKPRAKKPKPVEVVEPTPVVMTETPTTIEG